VDGILEDLTPTTTDMALAFGINDVGGIVGLFNDHPTLWRDGVAQELELLPGFTAGSARAINNAGQIVGILTPPSIHGFLYSGGRMEDFSVLGGWEQSSATGINNAGDVILSAGTLPTSVRGYLYSGGRFVVIPGPGGQRGTPTGINDHRHIVGSFPFPTSPTQTHPFLYRDRVVSDLNTLISGNSAWELLTAEAINNRGQIVGTGTLNGELRGYLLTPASWPVPGTIEAENFDDGGEGIGYYDGSPGNEGGAYRDTDVDIAPATEGAFTVGWAGAPEWLQYTIDVKAAGVYRVDIRVASLDRGGTFHLQIGGVDKSDRVRIPDTGDWQAWHTVTTFVELAAGVQPMRLVLDENSEWGGVGNFNWIRLSLITREPFGGEPRLLPGVVEAEDFDEGGEDVAYHDDTPGNIGGHYRDSDVDIADASEGGYTVGWAGAPEWLTYTVNVMRSGTYVLELRVASAGPGGRFHVEFDGTDVTGPLMVPDTGDWQQWRTIWTFVTLHAGIQSMNLVLDENSGWGGAGNFNWLRVREIPQVTAGEWVVPTLGSSQKSFFTFRAADLFASGYWGGGDVPSRVACQPCLPGTVVELSSHFDNPNPQTIVSVAGGQATLFGTDFAFVEFGGDVVFDGGGVTIPQSSPIDVPELISVSSRFEVSGRLKGYEVLGLREPRLVFELPLKGRGLATLELLTERHPSGVAMRFYHLHYEIDAP
jgi:probable HAF family extracellular repeat protein